MDVISDFARDDVHQASKMIIFADTTEQDVFSIDSLHQSTLNDGGNELADGCGFDSMDHPHPSLNPAYEEAEVELKKRQSTPNGLCLPSLQVLPMGVAADCTYTDRFGGSANALTRILSNWNQASDVYEKTFNVQLAVIEVKIMSGCGDFLGETLEWNRLCTDSYTINRRLSDFSKWRGEKSEQDEAGLWHLMSKFSSF